MYFHYFGDCYIPLITNPLLSSEHRILQLSVNFVLWVVNELRTLYFSFHTVTVCHDSLWYINSTNNNGIRPTLSSSLSPSFSISDTSRPRHHRFSRSQPPTIAYYHTLFVLESLDENWAWNVFLQNFSKYICKCKLGPWRIFRIIAQWRYFYMSRRYRPICLCISVVDEGWQ